MFWRNLFRLNARFLIEALQALIPGPAIGAVLIFNTEGATRMGEITVSDTETTLRSTIRPLDAEGYETTLDGPPTYSSSDDTVATVTPDPNDASGLTATYQIGGPGDAVITVDTGLDDGQGGTIQGKGTIHVTPGGVSVLDVNFTTGGATPTP